MQVKEPMVQYILSKPKERQVKAIAHQIIKLIGNMYPIVDQEIRKYTERILTSLNSEQLQDILVRKWSYADKIKAKVRLLADAYAEEQFNDLVKIGKVVTKPSWKFPEAIVPGMLGASISHSLHKRAGSINNLERRLITDLASLPNIPLCHRNLGKGKGFAINGSKSNHYPDFIIVTKLENIILAEPKGDDRDNPDSAAKQRFGKRYADLSGEEFHYFMIYDKFHP